MRTFGVDTGGTFTDLVLRDGDDVRLAKVPSTPSAPAEAILGGLAELGGVRASDRVVHGTTVALNALLTRRLARTALVTNAGFRDLIEIGRQARPDIYALHPVRPEPLVPRALRFEVEQRTWPDERTREPVEVSRPSRAELAELRSALAARRVESVAVCLLHSWADPGAEERVRAALVGLGVPITLSAELVPEHREVERFSTAVVNASLAPLVSRYLGELADRIGDAQLSVLQSSGGTLPAADAGREPVRLILSGPAGGVVGATRAAVESGLGRIVTLDMGGTSTDVAFSDAGDPDGGVRRAGGTGDPADVDGHPIAVPSLDVHTIGCGGGSLVQVDAGGVLHVGPASAGADPGPVCYGSSTTPTVTDAHVLLGHIRAGAFLGGRLELDLDGVERAFAELAQRLGTRPRDAARAVLEVARAAMRRAVGVMTMQRGHDPAALALVGFGGAGGLHAASLAESLGMRTALVPRAPGALSAMGMTVADALRDHARTVLEPLEAWSGARREGVFAELAEQGRAELVAAGLPASRVRAERSLDLRYQGQSFELRVPDARDPEAAFHAAHEQLYGHRLEECEVELVCLRVRSRVPRPAPTATTHRTRKLPAAAVTGERSAVFGARAQRVPVIAREALPAGVRLEGPALVEEYSGTTLVPPGWTASVTAGGHLRLSR